MEVLSVSKISQGLNLLFCVLVSAICVNGDLYGADITAVDTIRAHNQIRSKVNRGEYSDQPVANPPVAPLAWDQALAESARAYAAGCVWKHSENRVNTGENLYASTDRNVSVFDAVASWAGEHADYDFASASCRPGKQCGHYTQIVWQNTLQVGCASVYCPALRYENGQEVFPGSAGSVYIVCQYRPGGNYVGRQPYRIDGRAGEAAIFDIDTFDLYIPYLLVHQVEGHVVYPYSAVMKLTSADPAMLRIQSVKPEKYLEEEQHTNRFDINSLQFFLPDMRVLEGAHISPWGYGVVLQYSPASGTFYLKSIQKSIQ
jgi:hypothetical protein